MNYKKLYDSIIENRKNNPIISTKYTEDHHIIPICMGGADTSCNIVCLSGREHVLVHKLLYKLFPDTRGVVQAYWLMIHTRDGSIINSKEFERLRDKKSKISSDVLKSQWKDPEYRENAIQRIKERWKDPHFKDVQSKMAKRMWDDENFRKMMSESASNLWRRPDFIKLMQDYWSNEENISKRSGEMKALWEREGFREYSSIRSKELWKDDEYRAKIIESSKSNWRDPNLRKQMIDSLVEFHRKTPTWRKKTSVSTQIYWSLARMFWNLSKYNPDCHLPIGYTEFCKTYDCGLHHNIYQRMLKRFSDGWIPEEDAEWMEDFDHYGFK